jgi:hypothetical protein
MSCEETPIKIMFIRWVTFHSFPPVMFVANAYVQSVCSEDLPYCQLRSLSAEQVLYNTSCNHIIVRSPSENDECIELVSRSLTASVIFRRQS